MWAIRSHKLFSANLHVINGWIMLTKKKEKTAKLKAEL